ncbi:hypothetical protein ABEB36_012177 [Hypothenemus hampei]|uniref:Glutamate receptor ionotropic, kainate 2 n=1 Tax=Hypothenemus hampei TaxID=57062 RepID=A0ABD1EB02_HYPHA
MVIIVGKTLIRPRILLILLIIPQATCHLNYYEQLEKFLIHSALYPAKRLPFGIIYCSEDLDFLNSYLKTIRFSVIVSNCNESLQYKLTHVVVFLQKIEDFHKQSCLWNSQTKFVFIFLTPPLDISRIIKDIWIKFKLLNYIFVYANTKGRLTVSSYNPFTNIVTAKNKYNYNLFEDKLKNLEGYKIKAVLTPVAITKLTHGLISDDNILFADYFSKYLNVSFEYVIEEKYNQSNHLELINEGIVDMDINIGVLNERNIPNSFGVTYKGPLVTLIMKPSDSFTFNMYRIFDLYVWLGFATTFLIVYIFKHLNYNLFKIFSINEGLLRFFFESLLQIVATAVLAWPTIGIFMESIEDLVKYNFTLYYSTNSQQYVTPYIDEKQVLYLRTMDILKKIIHHEFLAREAVVIWPITYEKLKMTNPSDLDEYYLLKEAMGVIVYAKFIERNSPFQNSLEKATQQFTETCIHRLSCLHMMYHTKKETLDFRRLNVHNSFHLFKLWIGAGLFEENENQLNPASFELAIRHANEKLESNHKINNITSGGLPTQEPFYAIKTICSLIENGIIGVFGPESLSNINAIQSVCDEKELPHILTRWIYYPLRPGTAINFYPYPPLLGKAYWDIIQSWRWKTFTVLYENDESLLRLSDLILTAKDNGVIVTVEQLDRDDTGHYRDALKRVWKTRQRYLVIDCHINILVSVLEQCQQLGLMTNDYSYFLTNLDAHTRELSPFQWSQTNITGIRIINPDSEYVQSIASILFPEFDAFQSGSKLESETALIYDAVQMFSEIIQKVALSDSVLSLDCYSTSSWELGYTLVNLLKTSSYKGLTGHIEFNNEGYRNVFGLQIYELREGGIVTVASYNSIQGLNVTRQYHHTKIDEKDSMRNKTFKVIISLTEPYGMLKETSENLVGNERYEGFSIDLIQELAILENFNYTFTVQHDGANGKKDPKTGKWSGMIGAVISGEADMAITDLTITSERAEDVDFTSPFMNLGISILFQKPSKAPPNFFSFAEPFAIDTWAALAVAFVVVSLSFFLLGRICPNEWTNPYPCVEEPEFLINQFNMSNSVWFVTGAMLQQGSEIAPIAIPTRLVSGVWWFFVLIMVSSYTANLASFLVTENNIEIITDVESLVQNAEKYNIHYGSKINGTTMEFFEKSTGNPLYQEIYTYMKTHPQDMPGDNSDGVAMAEKGLYAFFMESISIDYNTQRHCNLTKVGEPLDEKGYGIALRKDSPYRTKLSTAILKLQSLGAIEKIRKKWWEERKGGGQCTGSDVTTEATPLNLQNVEGIFYVTIFGTILGVVLVLFEYSLYIIRLSKKTKIPILQTLKQELKFFFKFGSNVKPVLDGSEDDEKSERKSGSEHSNTKSMKSGTTTVNGDGRRPYGFIISSPSLDRLTEMQ